jgi:hypothetical protein
MNQITYFYINTNNLLKIMTAIGRPTKDGSYTYKS